MKSPAHSSANFFASPQSAPCICLSNSGRCECRNDSCSSVYVLGTLGFTWSLGSVEVDIWHLILVSMLGSGRWVQGFTWALEASLLGSAGIIVGPVGQ